MVASNNWDDITFREELDEIAHRENVTIVHTLSNPPEAWQGEGGGRSDSAMLSRYLPTGSHRWQYSICGPDPMMDAMEHALLELDVPDGRIHTERFGWV